jgi:MOSC domain-containing protein YiiM
MSMPTVSAVFIKPNPGKVMIVPDERHICLVRGYGIEGDSNAHSFSPRQVLITRNEDLDAFGIQPGALRENLVIAQSQEDSLKPGALVHFGQSAQVRLTFYCEPCKRIAHLVPSLQAITRRRGIVGVVLGDGVVAVGDEVVITPDQFPPFPENPYQRFLAFMALVPKGKVVSYKQITTGMGVATSYVRAIPGYIQRTSSTMYPLHRIVDCDGTLVNQYVPEQEFCLSEEGVPVTRALSIFPDDRVYSVSLAECGWNGASLYLV